MPAFPHVLGPVIEAFGLYVVKKMTPLMEIESVITRSPLASSIIHPFAGTEVVLGAVEDVTS